MDQQDLARRIAAGENVPRPDTPYHLDAFTHRLYDERCLRCGETGPLEVAHLDDWPTVRDAARGHPELAISAYWTFHGPSNVVLLCPTCHTRLDKREYSDVAKSHIIALRDKARKQPRFGDEVRRFLCREMQFKQRREWIDIEGLGPLMLWLEEAITDGVLTPPYQYNVPYRDGFWHVDLEAEQWAAVSDTTDPALPTWNGNGFDDPAASQGWLMSG